MLSNTVYTLGNALFWYHRYYSDDILSSVGYGGHLVYMLFTLLLWGRHWCFVVQFREADICYNITRIWSTLNMSPVIDTGSHFQNVNKYCINRLSTCFVYSGCCIIVLYLDAPYVYICHSFLFTYWWNKFHMLL